MNAETQIIIAEKPLLPAATVGQAALQLKEEALAASSLIGKVANGEQNNLCVNARKNIKAILSLAESQRKKLKEPYLEAGRTIDRTIEGFVLELEKESGRLENLEKDFIRAELRRKADEEELQRKELARIQAEKDAELKRIADEQARVEREAKEAAEAAAKLAAEATNKKQREAAEAARLESERLTREAEAAKATAAAATARVEETASNAAYVESRPPEISRAKGQAIRKKWIIEQINDFQLMRARPDLVRKIEFDMVALHQALSDGATLPGVKAREDIAIGLRGERSLEPINV